MDKDQFKKLVKSMASIVHIIKIDQVLNMKRLDDLEEQIKALNEKLDHISDGEGGVKAGSTEHG